jgi:hypothetical protein
MKSLLGVLAIASTLSITTGLSARAQQTEPAQPEMQAPPPPVDEGKPWNMAALGVGAVGGLVLADSLNGGVMSVTGIATVVLGALAGQYVYDHTNWPAAEAKSP